MKLDDFLTKYALFQHGEMVRWYETTAKETGVLYDYADEDDEDPEDYDLYGMTINDDYIYFRTDTPVRVGEEGQVVIDAVGDFAYQFRVYKPTDASEIEGLVA